MTCQHCAGLARRVADLQSEIEAWRAHDRQDVRERIEAERFAAWRAAIPARPAVVRAIMTLCDAAPRAVSIDTLGGSTRGADVYATVKVVISQGRAVLRDLGVVDAIECLSGYGYRMSAEAAGAVERLTEGGA